MAKNPTLAQKAVVEGLGAFLLVFLGAGSIITSSYFFPGSSQLLVVALAHGLALAIAVSIAMGISGGHINPAVTIAMLVSKRIGVRDSAVYIISQLVGAVIGAGVLLLIPSAFAANSMLGAPSLNSSVSVWQGIALEGVITFVLVTAVFGTAIDKRAPKIGGFGIGLALMLGILVVGPLTGAAANPARAFGPEFVIGNFTNWYVYWIGPILGAIIAALIYEYVILRNQR